MNSGKAVDQDGVIARVFHDVEKLLDVGVGGNAAVVGLWARPGLMMQAEIVQAERAALAFFLLIRGWFVGGGRITQRDDGLDAMIVDEPFEPVPGQLAAAVQYAGADHMKIAIVLISPGGIGQGHADEQPKNDAGKCVTEKAWHFTTLAAHG